jgi:hypothetical protein
MSDSGCPLERFFCRARAEAPGDAAERILRGLDPAVLDRRLYWASVERAASVALRVSFVVLLLGLAALTVCLVHAHRGTRAAQPLALADAAVLDARRLADPFAAEEK